MSSVSVQFVPALRMKASLQCNSSMPLNLGGLRECEHYEILSLKIHRDILLEEYSEAYFHIMSMNIC